MGAVTDWIRRVFGVNTATKDSTATLNALTAIRIAPADPNRFAIQVFNLGAGTAYLGFGSRTTATRGIQLNALGGALGYNAKTDLELPTREIYAIGSAATTLFIVETAAI